MNKIELLLTQLAEECNETAQRASKAIRFTLEEIQPNQEEQLTNAQRIVYEFNDIVAVMEVLMEEGAFPRVVDREAISRKKIKINEWLKYSKKVGTLIDIDQNDIVHQCNKCQYDNKLGFCPKCDTQAHS